MTSREQDPWKQLLNMSTGLTAQSGASGPPPEEIPKGDLEFLQKALIGENAGGKIEGPSMIQRFFNYNQTDFDTDKFLDEPARIEAAKDLADQLEDFFTMGNYADQFTNDDGIQALVNLTFHTNEEIQLLYLRLIPLIAENDGPIQSKIGNSSIFKKYLDELSRYSSMKSSNLMALIAAISSIIRGSNPVLRKFVEFGGMEKVFEVVEKVENDKCGGKAAHLFYSIHASSDLEELEPHREVLEEYLVKTRNELVNRELKMKKNKKEGAEETVEFVEETRKKIGNLISTFKKDQSTGKNKKKAEKPLMLA